MIEYMNIEISNGELVDKFSILLIKEQRISDPHKLFNIKKEIDSIKPAFDKIMNDNNLLFYSLKDINEQLWELEDNIRKKEEENKFDLEFVEYARLIYKKNDERYFIKRTINENTKSNIKEEKSYDTGQ